MPSLPFLDRLMPSLSREQIVAVGALAGLLLGCLCLIGFSVQARMNTATLVEGQRELLTRLSGAKPGSLVRGVEYSAPDTAFIEAPTQGVAAAKLQTYLTETISREQATLISSGVEQGARTDAADAIRIQASVTASLNSLQRILYNFETATPYVFVDALTVQPADNSDPRVVDESKLRVTMKLRAIWRRGGSAS